MPLTVPYAVPLVVASPPALIATSAGRPASAESLPGVPSPYVLRGADLSPRAVAELLEDKRRGWKEWDPRPWWLRPSWPDPPPLMELDSNQKVFLTQADDLSDLRGTPGISFVVIGTISGKTVKVSGPGTAARPIVLRGASDDDGNGGANYPELSGCSGELFGTGSVRCTFYRLRCLSCNFAPSAFSYCRVARVRWYGNTGGTYCVEITAPSSDNLRVDRCLAGSLGAAKSDSGFVKLWGGGNVEACYNHCLDAVSNPLFTQSTIMSLVYGANVGQDPIDKRPGFGFWGHHTLASGVTGSATQNFTEFKLTDGLLTDNTILYDVAGGPGINMRLRHGLRFRCERNLSLYLGAGRGGGDIQLRDCDHFVGENASLNPAGTVNAGTGILISGGNIDADRWVLDRIPQGGHNWENCKRAHVGGNAMHVTIGAPEATFPDLPNYYKADGCVVPPDGRADGNDSSTQDPLYQVNTDRTTLLAYRLANARALVALGPTDVGLTLP